MESLLTLTAAWVTKKSTEGAKQPLPAGRNGRAQIESRMPARVRVAADERHIPNIARVG